MWLAEQEFFLRMCVRWLRGSRDDADDVMSKGAINACTYLRSHVAQVQRYRPWMLRILHNLCIDVLRARARDAGLEQCAPVEAFHVAGEARAPQRPDQALESQELMVSIARAAATLPPRLHEVFSLRFLHGLPYDEISRRLLSNSQIVRKRVQQVRELLRAELRRVAP